MINSKKVFQTRKDSKDLLGGAQILQISISTLPKILITKFGGQFYSKLVAYILYSRCGKTQYINWTPAVRFL